MPTLFLGWVFSRAVCWVGPVLQTLAAAPVAGPASAPDMPGGGPPGLSPLFSIALYAAIGLLFTVILITSIMRGLRRTVARETPGQERENVLLVLDPWEESAKRMKSRGRRRGASGPEVRPSIPPEDGDRPSKDDGEEGLDGDSAAPGGGSS